MKTLYACVIAILLCCSLQAGAQTYDATETFYKLRSKIEQVKDYTADVVMHIQVPFMKVPRLTGKLFFKSPGMLKLERKGGIAILPKKSINLTLDNMIPLGKVTVIDAGMDSTYGKDVHVIKIVPDNDQTDIILTKVWIDTKRMLAVRTETTTKENGTMKMNLEYGTYASIALPDKVSFIIDVKDYKLPKGVTMDYNADEVVKPTKQSGNPLPIKKGKIQIQYSNYQINKGLSDDIFLSK
jgi:outer membrane lipoprotein-sorting protein